MPVVTCQIVSVTARTVKGGVKYDVFPIRPAGATGWSPVYETWNQWHAAICQRSADTQTLITLGLRETRYGLEIVTAELQEKAS